MKLYKKNLLGVFLYSIFFLLTIFIYFLLSANKTDIEEIIFRCVISAELISFINFIFFNFVTCKVNLPIFVGGYTLSIIYPALTVLVSVLFLIYYPNAEKTYFIIFLVVTAIFIISAILIYIWGKSNESDMTKDKKSNALFKKLEYKIRLICSDNQDSEFAPILTKISEMIQSCDQSSYVSTDDEIYNCLEILLDRLNNNKETKMICEKIFSLLSQRTVEVNQLKSGGI